MTLPLHDPSQWPVRMTRREVAAVLRCAVRTLFTRIARHRFPEPDSDHCWDRDIVIRYCRGGIRALDERAEKDARAAARQSAA